MNNPIETILSRLENVQGGPDQWSARCPSHDDRRNSLSVKKSGDGQLLIYCHAGCSSKEVVESLGLEMKDLFPSAKRGIIATYDYTDENGNLLYQIVRYEPKDFRLRRPDGQGGWIWNRGDTKRVLYHLPTVLEQVKNGGRIFIVEGEKDVHAIETLGLVATCNPGGAGKWSEDFTESLRGAQVVILPDNDKLGREHAQKVKHALEGIAASIKIISLQGLADKGDVSDWIETGGTAKKLDELLNARPQGLTMLLDDMASFISRYVFFASEEQLWAVTLWAFHTHVIDQFEVTPYLHVGSAEKRSGKTRLYEVLMLMVKNPWHAVTPSDAIFFRKIKAHNPTLLLDEVDAIWNYKTASQHEDLRASINAGYRRGASVDRCVGRGFKLEAFPVFCAKALAGIGRLPETVADRCIPIRMVRKTKDEKVERFRNRDVQPEAQALYAQISACAAELELSVYPDMPEGLNDRAEEVWEPLIMIADLAGGHWPERARMAAIKLSSDFEPDDDSLGVRLLADCRAIFDDVEHDRLSSSELLSHLKGLEESPWDDMGLTLRRLASMLKKYGVRSGDHRFKDKTLKGYLRSDFEEAWRRYTPKPGDKRNKGNTGSTTPPKTADESPSVADVADKHSLTEKGSEHLAKTWTELADEASPCEGCPYGPFSFDKCKCIHNPCYKCPDGPRSPDCACSNAPDQNEPAA